jgi:hypothetical protein
LGFASTTTWYRWPMPTRMFVVLYGLIGTKSASTTVRMWLSIEKINVDSNEVLIMRRR